MPRAACPACDNTFSIPGKLHLGQKVLCSSCDAHLQVVWLDPLELDWVDYEEEEDEDEEIEEYQNSRDE